ncbi:MAG: NUDIX hydrolase [Candidatus Limnocylindrales bacterium]|jgi:ADP-ribose pyrophosphatase
MTDPFANRRPRPAATGRPVLDAVLTDLATADTELEERVVRREEIYRGRYMVLEKDEVVRPDGSASSRDIVLHPGAVVIAPLDADGRLFLVVQYRLAGNGAMLELPAGTLDVHDGVVEDPETAAHRELEEETGYRAGSMERIGGYYSAPGFLTEYLSLFLATDLQPAVRDRLSPDDDERIRLVRLHWREAIAAINTGLIEDSKSIAGILLLARRLEARGR